ncbi:MAG TPA: hypothetical protein VFP33_10090 [Gallionella sp.]|nr:hypothetical protein [Gallionella sp.]
MNFTLDETDYTGSLKSAIDDYVRSRKVDVQGASTPHSSRQSSTKINSSHCFDLIKRISESSILILEVKVTHDGKTLPSFDPIQRKIDAALRDAGIPIDYCYNLVEDYLEINQSIYTLQNSNTSTPEMVSDDGVTITSQQNHKKLQALIDELLNSASSVGENVAALFAKGILERIRSLNIKTLFFCRWEDSFEIYTGSELCELYEQYEKEVQLGVGINFMRSSKKQIVDHLEDAKQRWLNRENLKPEVKGASFGHSRF